MDKGKWIQNRFKEVCNELRMRNLIEKHKIPEFLKAYEVDNFLGKFKLE